MSLDADAIAAVALAIERHSAREFVELLGNPKQKRAVA